MRLLALVCVLPLFLAIGTLGARAAQSPAKADAGQKPAANAASAPSPDPASADPEYVIGPEDVLNVSVWKEEGLSAAVPVRPDGKISIPLINDVTAAGLTPMQLSSNIKEQLKKYIDDPQVTVTVTQVNSRRVYLVGQVARAGAFQLLPHMTVLQALSSAGGLSEFADQKKIYVLRNHEGKPSRIPFNYKDVLAGIHPEQNIELEPGDTIVVP